MKERLYNEQGRLTPQGEAIASQFWVMVHAFIENKSERYDIRDLENLMHWTINDEIVNKIIGI